MRKFLYGLFVSVCMLMLSGVATADTVVDTGLLDTQPLFSVDVLTLDDPDTVAQCPNRLNDTFDVRTSWRMPVLAVKPLAWIPNYQLRNYRRAGDRGDSYACGYDDTHSHPEPRIPIAV